MLAPPTLTKPLFPAEIGAFFLLNKNFDCYITISSIPGKKLKGRYKKLLPSIMIPAPFKLSKFPKNYAKRRSRLDGLRMSLNRPS